MLALTTLELNNKLKFYLFIKKTFQKLTEKNKIQRKTILTISLISMTTNKSNFDSKLAV